MDGNLHIYGQKWWHDDVVIIGSTTALGSLRDAITQAIENKIGQTDNVMTNDGEGYTVRVMWNDDEDLWPTFATPYSDPDAQTAMNVGKVIPKD